jgi:pimeloyl-ACP methyl ester carboxylesterase
MPISSCKSHTHRRPASSITNTRTRVGSASAPNASASVSADVSRFVEVTYPIVSPRHGSLNATKGPLRVVRDPRVAGVAASEKAIGTAAVSSLRWDLHPLHGNRRGSQHLHMTLSTFLLGLGALLAAGVAALVLGFRRYRAASHARLDTVERRVIELSAGAMEIAERGSGPPLLISHGIFHGSDGGLTAVRHTITDRRVISPSRFGYLGSAMPAAPSGAAQGDAFADLLDSLGISSADVLGISAGTSAAVQMALRHPDRVDHLVISSGNWPGSPTSLAPPGWAKAFYSDGAMWTLKTLLPPFVRQLMGVPRGFPHTDAEAKEVEVMLDSIFPIAPRRLGAIFDAYVSNPDITQYPLEEIAIPTLIIHAEDDPLASYEAAAGAATRIPDATLVTLESGGHLGLGQTERTRSAIDSFLRTRSTT